MQSLDLTVSQTAVNLVKGVFAEHKKTRVSGDPRDFVDCYFDELEKVCVCVPVLALQHNEYQNSHSTSIVRTLLGSKDIIVGPHVFKRTIAVQILSCS